MACGTLVLAHPTQARLGPLRRHTDDKIDCSSTSYQIRSNEREPAAGESVCVPEGASVRLRARVSVWVFVDVCMHAYVLVCVSFCLPADLCVYLTSCLYVCLCVSKCLCVSMRACGRL